MSTALAQHPRQKKGRLRDPHLLIKDTPADLIAPASKNCEQQTVNPHPVPFNAETELNTCSLKGHAAVTHHTRHLEATVTCESSPGSNRHLQVVTHHLCPQVVTRALLSTALAPVKFTASPSKAPPVCTSCNLSSHEHRTCSPQRSPCHRVHNTVRQTPRRNASIHCSA